MKLRVLSALSLLAVSVAAFADETPAAPAPEPAAAPAPEPAAAPAPEPAAAAAPRPVRRTLPPEAFTTPTNFVVLVNVDGAVDDGWLERQAAAMQRSLQVGVKTYSAKSSEGEAPLSVSRDFAKNVFKMMPDAKILVFLAEGDDLPPILASPYEHWVIMDAGWVKRGGGDEALLNERMGKRVYQALGACCGAAYHPEREAVMRYSPTPESLDNCLSRNFHPLNCNAFSIVARSIGLDPVRLRPRKELMEMGILQPRHAEPKGEGAETQRPGAL